MTFGDYLGGVLGLAAVASPIALATVRLRARLLPGWSGAPARLAEAVLGASLITVLLQILGAFGILEPAVLIGASVAVGVAIHRAPWLQPGASGEGAASGGGAAAGVAPPSPPIPTLHAVVALAGAAFVAAHWATGLQDVWARGILTFDALWYHAPFAARIAEAGSVWGLHFTDPLYLNWFSPQNSELLHGAGITLFDRDLFSPLVNFAWLGIALLAAWCIGRPYGVAPLTLLAVAIIMDTGPIAPHNAGTALTDTAPVAMLLAAAALLINAWASDRETFCRGALLTAGLAMGVGLGTKLTIAGATAAMAVGIPLIVEPDFRRRALGLFVGGVAITAGFWFLRNLIHAGNPLPWIQHIGPIDLPGPGRGVGDPYFSRHDYSVAHYILVDPDFDIWRRFYRQITDLFGPVWFLLLGAPAVGAILALCRPRSPAVRLCGAVTVAAAVNYLFTPLTAAGPEGDPIGFGINLRYLVPGIALGLALIPLAPRLTPGRLRLPLLGGGLAALLLTSLNSDSARLWDQPFTSIPAAVLIGIVLIGAPVGLALLARRGARLAAVAGAVLALAVAAVGWERQDDYFAHRYNRSEERNEAVGTVIRLFRFQLDNAFRWAKPIAGQRIAVAGTSGGYYQYGLYGDDLTNFVQYVGEHGDNGNFTRIEECAPFREALNDGDYDYLVTTPKLNFNDSLKARPSPERGWVQRDPALERVLQAGRVGVFRIRGELDPAACEKPAATDVTTGSGGDRNGKP